MERVVEVERPGGEDSGGPPQGRSADAAYGRFIWQEVGVLET
jgi:hypothetical protein